MITCSCTALAASRITSMHHSVLDMKTMWCRMSQGRDLIFIVTSAWWLTMLLPWYCCWRWVSLAASFSASVRSKCWIASLLGSLAAGYRDIPIHVHASIVHDRRIGFAAFGCFRKDTLPSTLPRTSHMLPVYMYTAGNFITMHGSNKIKAHALDKITLILRTYFLLSVSLFLAILQISSMLL